MKRKDKIILYIFIIFLLFNNIAFAWNSSTDVKVIVSPMQELLVKEPVGVSFNYPWTGMESGQPLLFKDVGSVNIKSNVDWILNIDFLETYRELEIYIRPVGERNAKWQRVDGSNGILIGRNGSQYISWDIKIVQSRTNYGLNNRIINSDRESL